MKTLLSLAIPAAQAASKAILQIYASSDFSIETKSDNSPLTRADRASHEIIFAALSQTGIPILSEEGRDIAYAERGQWERFWLVDPLDGTKEFIKRNGEFTVNIALIEGGAPVLGVVLAPVLGTLYFGAKGLGAWKLEQCSRHEGAFLDELLAVSTSLPDQDAVSAPRPYTIVGSRSHPSPELAAFAEEMTKIHGQVDVRSIGSSLKICLVAEGAADVYPRLGPTMEWDTAAGQAVAVHAGCRVNRHDTGEPLHYNKQSLLNPFFIVERDR
ncbi:3'(2'),5'-bisphosphate nucleotidase CysQ [Desulfomicrobium sp. ZS1]|uniref:3'(2'),5'-bisphosphate nucleotidase CysQ n=1 Tax=Desulfomicrobium sp. ZS1 TaxID=2952228 RepID=UPI0020B3ACFD|nr:3'(2'),5'-bisphosphate nucleotidase CysQ [Desulfomicrobium sp. ZS1]UTF49416.1 3'(2'),5'-bisphosphate nucleotidase CysQ [Desulfomicrobium sp. ZS1]